MLDPALRSAHIPWAVSERQAGGSAFLEIRGWPYLLPESISSLKSRSYLKALLVYSSNTSSGGFMGEE